MQPTRSLFAFVAILVLAIAVARPLAGQESKATATPTVRLVYDLPAYELSQVLARKPCTTLDQLVDGAIATVRRRLDPAIVVTRAGTGFTVDLAGDAEATAALRRRIEALGKLELRVVATEDFLLDGVAFNLGEEKKRLQAWLEHGGRELVRENWKNIERFNDDPAKGPLAFGHLKWYAHLVEPKIDNKELWGTPFALDTTPFNGITPMGPATVTVYDQATEWNGGGVPEAMKQKDKPFLLELVAINMKERHFGSEDLDPARVRPGVAADRRPAVDYAIKSALSGDYADWSQKYIKKHIAIIVNGTIRSAPYFASRIHGLGFQIICDFTEGEVEDLAACLRSGELPIAPVFLRKEHQKPPK